MPAPMDVVEIPPPDHGETPLNRRRLLPLLAVVGLFAGALFLSQTRPRTPAYTWSLIQGPPGLVNLDSLVALGDRFAMLSAITDRGVSIWWSDRSGEWASQPVDGSPTQLAAGGNRLAAYRVSSGEVLGHEPDGWVSQYEVEFPEETRSRQASGRPSVVLTDESLLVLTLFGDVWRSSSGSEFRRVIEDPSWGQGVELGFLSACRPPNRSSPDVPPLVVAESRILALTSSNTNEPFGVWPVCEPVLWSSDKGIDWSSTQTNLTEAGNYVYDLAWRDGLFVAVGGRGIDEPLVWTSADGVEWDEVTITTQTSVVFFRVEAGDAGWVILGRDVLGTGSVGWTSADGSCWERMELPVGGSEAVVAEEAILLVDRASYPDLWLGSPTGSRGTCR